MVVSMVLLVVAVAVLLLLLLLLMRGVLMRMVVLASMCRFALFHRFMSTRRGGSGRVSMPATIVPPSSPSTSSTHPNGPGPQIQTRGSCAEGKTRPVRGGHCHESR